MKHWKSQRGLALFMVLIMMVLLLALLSQSTQAYMVLRQQNKSFAEEVQKAAEELAPKLDLE